MTIYYRPILQTGPCPPDALRLHGLDLWFDRVECHQRDCTFWVLGVSDLPQNVKNTLCAPLKGPKPPRLMGVLNVTPDSFSDGGKFNALDAAIARAEEMVAQGCEIIDIGGESTRPGAEYVDIEEEIQRTAPVIKALRDHGLTAPISIDTRKAQVAEAALEAGATHLNDVSALTHDPDMSRVASKFSVPICLMHAQGDPATMQQDPQYDDVLLDVYDHLDARISAAVAAGVSRCNIVIDPGIGFGKTQEHNLTLLRKISIFHGLGCPILLGVSRKRFIGSITGTAVAEDRMVGSVTIALDALGQGVQTIRAHDIDAHRQAFAMWDALHGTQS